MTAHKILWVTTEANPYPRSGGGLRSLRLVQAVAASWPVAVVNIGLGLQVAEYRDASGAVEAQSVAPQPFPPPVRLLAAMALRQPLAPSRLRSPVVRDLVRRTHAAGGHVVFEHAATLAHRPTTERFTVLLHNVDSELLVALERPTSTLRRALLSWEHRAMVRLERSLVADPAALVVAVSARDAALLGRGARVVPNGADLPPALEPVPKTGTALFVGSMGYPPNESAVRWWAHAVHPLGGLPPLTVVGQRAAEVLADLAGHPALDIVGEVEDPAPYLRAARAVVLPIRDGSGTRLKLVEALAHGRPVVSTRKGSEGFSISDGREALLADEAADFATAVRRVMRDDDLSAALAKAGRDLAEAYAWPRLGGELVELLRGHDPRLV